MDHNSNPDTRMSLIMRMREGRDEEAWSEFVQVYQPLVERIIQRHRLQYADAAEVTQEVLSRVAQSIQSWEADRERSTFRGWLYRITRNLTIDFLRRRKRQDAKISLDQDVGQIQEMKIDPSDADSIEFQAEFERQLFHWAAQQLKPSFKPVNWKAFWMTTVEGRPINEVAEELGIECGTIYVARSRIMARLSKLIQQRLDETLS